MQETDLPRIMICLLAKNDAKYLPKFLEAMSKLDYPKEKLRWVWIYGKSIDFTLDTILEFHKKNTYKFEVYEEPVFQRPLNSPLYNARLCNEFKKLYQGEEYILFADCDIEEIPPQTLKELIKADKDIVAPYVYRKTTGNKVYFYDTYVFRFHGWKFEYVKYKGKVYDYKNPLFKDRKEPVELDSVGTFFLIKAKVFQEVEWDNPVPHLQFCKNARAKGFHVWALPYIKIYHSNLEAGMEAPHYSLEWYVLNGMLPQTELFKVGYEKKGKKWKLKTWD